MVRDDRVKEYIIPQWSVNAANNSVVTDQVINGEITNIIFTNAASAGSYTFTESGIGVNILTNVVTSGTASTQVYPRPYSNISVGGTSGSPDQTFQVVNSPIIMTVSGLTSGTNNIVGPIYIRYR